MTDELPDIVASDLEVLFCGINPGLTAATTGHHFAGRGNRFWRVLHLARFTPEEIAPEDARAILRYGCGLTTVVARPTAAADQLSPDEFDAAAQPFRRKLARLAPRRIAFLGKAAYAALTKQRDIAWGRQNGLLEGAVVWVLPNPSGRNRAFTLAGLVDAYGQLHEDMVSSSTPSGASPLRSRQAPSRRGS